MAKRNPLKRLPATARARLRKRPPPVWVAPMLATLTDHPRVVFTRRQLLDHVWGEGWFGDEHVIDVHVAKLRRKLGAPDLVRTVRGVGFRIGGKP